MMRGLFIGRFQPFHKGHLVATKQILEECDSLIIGVGSAQEERTQTNPLSGGERITMIKRVVENRGLEPIEIYPVPDLNCHPAWPYYVESLLPNFDKVYGNSEVVLDLFDYIGYKTGEIEQVEREQYKGTEIRKKIRDGEEWKDLVPEEVVTFLGEINMNERLKPPIEVKSETEKKAAHLLRKENKTIAVAESCSGGVLSDRLTNVPGSSSYFIAGVITYSNDSKVDILNVKRSTIEKKGAVSSEVAEQMAKGIRLHRGTDIGISTTGIAGPGGGSKEKPVGTVHIGLSTEDKTTSRKYRFSGERQEVKKQTSEKALKWLIESLEN